MPIEKRAEGMPKDWDRIWIDPLFEFHKLNPVGIDKAQQIAGIFSFALAGLRGLCPDGREFSIVKTKLEEACFFAKKAMAMDPANQEPKPNDQP